MRTTTTIEGLTLENLVDLFSTATYGSSWLEIDTTDQTEVEAEEGDCREDIWAKALLRGESIGCIDHYAEGEIYGILGTGVVSDDGDESVCYLITLQDVIDGLQKCADGTFKGDKSSHAWLAECFHHFKDNDSMEMDQPEAEAIMQVIMFNELIYG
jgi:hypothetical protein